MRYTICIESERFKMMKTKDSIFTVTFTDGGEVFIQAMDEGHARRIVDGQSWQRNVEEKPFSRTIEKIEKVNG
jgi:hypothetical protein